MYLDQISLYAGSGLWKICFKETVSHKKNKIYSQSIYITVQYRKQSLHYIILNTVVKPSPIAIISDSKTAVWNLKAWKKNKWIKPQNFVCVGISSYFRHQSANTSIMATFLSALLVFRLFLWTVRVSFSIYPIKSNVWPAPLIAGILDTQLRITPRIFV